MWRRHDTDPQRRQAYLAAGAATLRALLATPYLAGAGAAALLSHGTADLPAGSADSGLVYGDYYLLVAMAQCGRLPACAGAATAEGVAGGVAAGSMVEHTAQRQAPADM